MKTILIVIVILFAVIGITATVAFLVFCYQEGRKKTNRKPVELSLNF